MEGFVEFDDVAEEKPGGRRVLYAGHYMQLVLTTLEPGAESGEEVHEDRDRFFCVEAGKGELVIDGAKRDIAADFAVIVPAGARHNVRNVGREPLKLYTLCGPPERARSGRPSSQTSE
ncbi:MAG TPA: cupin domain-containing protein [Polyangiaceae bacterium]|nr:cupin domain-containing protein [Polyangiaceae bacterium]